MKKIWITILSLFLVWGYSCADSFPSFPMSLYGNIQVNGVNIPNWIMQLYDGSNQLLSTYTISEVWKYWADTALKQGLSLSEFPWNLLIKVIYNGTTYTISQDQIDDVNKGEGCPSKSAIQFVSKSCRYDIKLVEQITTPASSWGWWGGWGGVEPKKDPIVEANQKTWDQILTPTVPITTGVQNQITDFIQENNNKPEIVALFLKAVSSTEKSKVSSELKQAYLFSYVNGITTKPTIDEAKLEIRLSRGEMAKMMSEYAIKVLWRTGTIENKCVFTDISTISPDLQEYIKTACNLWIMWINADWTPSKIFNPYELVNRAQFATVLSRVIWWDTYNNWEEYYTNHIKALNEAGIINNLDPNLEELRWYVMLMLMRAVK